MAELQYLPGASAATVGYSPLPTTGLATYMNNGNLPSLADKIGYAQGSGGFSLDTGTGTTMDIPATNGSSQWINGIDNTAAIGAGLGIGQLGLGLASYLENKKTADKQRELLGQQIASNRAEMAHREASRAALNKAFTSNK